ncbi:MULTISPECIES: hypothetical protein [Haloferax]|uniref:Uncharacterized protein n=2 Tax=Haloferax TaxID=2251 RepID=A0A6G1Z2E8_9EURY|nr:MULTISPECIES: hypothetical protein [Haloferax]KAB1187813.1 hypothetical protein Hfx1149_07115 [Haloferax sp. CBA1149]MRW80474.1 hypothetical protein [Haloferax marinisediminis]
MGTQTKERRYDAGFGWAIGMAVGLVFGVLGWVMTREITMLLVVFVATGSALGFALEQSLNPAPLTPRQRRLLLVFLTVGVVAGVLAFLTWSGLR